MASRWLAFLVWGLVAASGVGWLSSTTQLASPVPAHAVAVDTNASLRGDLTRLFGPPPQEAVAAAPARVEARFKLIGVVAPRGAAESRQGVALIAVDGKPAKAFRVGAVVEGDTVLLAVRPRAAELGVQGSPPALTLELNPLPPAATGTLAGGRAVPGVVGSPQTPVPAAASAELPGQASQTEPPPQPAVAPQILPPIPQPVPPMPSPQALPGANPA